VTQFTFPGGIEGLVDLADLLLAVEVLLQIYLLGICTAWRCRLRNNVWWTNYRGL